MAGIKRKEAPSKADVGNKKIKRIAPTAAKAAKTSSTRITNPLSESDTSDDAEEDFGGFADGDSDGDSGSGGDGNADASPRSNATEPVLKSKKAVAEQPKKFKLETSSADAHKAQRALAKERKLSKPNADSIQRSKKIWERLRRKSHVPSAERKALVAELFDTIQGRVRDFVFKHDSVRVVQCALKYANREQRKAIVVELKGDLRPLVESRYGKFLVAKMVVAGDQEIRNNVVPEFYGHVKRLINHPEASWIVDDIYRQIATPAQKAVMLREWYGAEFALFHKQSSKPTMEDTTADLSKILKDSPEKRKPILHFLHQMINALLQKKMTGFTMLHDAMLQYMLALAPGTAEHAEFLELLKSDIDKTEEGGGGDLFKNLSFTKSGSRLVCLALVYGSSKDRKVILRCFKNTVEMMACDPHAKLVLCVGLAVTDDTKTSGKAVFPELVGDSIQDEAQKNGRLVGLIANLHARLPLLYPLAGMARWLVSDGEIELFEEVYEIRKSTSKKAPHVREKELIAQISPLLLRLVAECAGELAATSFGCQFTTEVLLEAHGNKDAAMHSVAILAAGDPTTGEHPMKSAAAGRMLRTLVLGAKFDATTNKLHVNEQPFAFGRVLYPVLKESLTEWACGGNSFVVVALLESEVVDEDTKREILAALRKGKKDIKEAAESGDDPFADQNRSGEAHAKKKGKTESENGNPGTKMLLAKLQARGSGAP